MPNGYQSIAEAASPGELTLDRLHGALETLVGSTLVGVGFWSQAWDQAIAGAHAFASVGGAVIAAHGLWRIVRKHTRREERNRRQEDRQGQGKLI